MPASHTPPEHPNAALLLSATKGFDYLFSNDIISARKHFEPHDDPFHLLGKGVCAFLEAALGMESGQMTEASRCLALSEAGTRRQIRVPKPRDMAHPTRFTFGLEWEILNADAVVLLGLTNALSESYMGYLQCMYSLNSAHSKFTKLFKTVFPNGLPSELPSTGVLATSPTFQHGLSASPSVPASLSHKSSLSSLSSRSSVSSAASAATISHPITETSVKGGFFSRLNWTAAASEPVLPLATTLPDGPVEDLIVAGTAFGFGLFNLVFSLLPKKIQGLVGFFGFQHDRKLALKALALAATKEDVHGVFAGLVLMTYHGVVLLLSGYQADEVRLLAEYKAIVDRVENRYPSGALWILNRAKIMRMAYDADGAIRVLQDGLKPDRPHTFVQADMLLMFELAWTLLSQGLYLEAAEAFMKITEMNSWSHGTYYFIAAGCHLAVGDKDKAQAMMDVILEQIDKKKISGKDLPTEVYIKKKLTFYKDKQARRGGEEKRWIDIVKVNPAEEMGIFWNTHARIDASIAHAHIENLNRLTPIPAVHRITLETPTTPRDLSRSRFPTSNISQDLTSSIPTPLSATNQDSMVLLDDLDTADELAVRALLLGIHHRTTGDFDVARGFFVEAHAYTVVVNTWVGGIAMFELAVLDLKDAEARTGGVRHGRSTTEEPVIIVELKSSSEQAKNSVWEEALKSASEKLDVVLSLAGSNVDLSSRLDSRVTMLRDEIAAKRDMIGVDA